MESAQGDNQISDKSKKGITIALLVAMLLTIVLVKVSYASHKCSKTIYTQNHSVYGTLLSSSLSTLITGEVRRLHEDMVSFEHESGMSGQLHQNTGHFGTVSGNMDWLSNDVSDVSAALASVDGVLQLITPQNFSNFVSQQAASLEHSFSDSIKNLQSAYTADYYNSVETFLGFGGNDGLIKQSVAQATADDVISNEAVKSYFQTLHTDENGNLDSAAYGQALSNLRHQVEQFMLNTAYPYYAKEANIYASFARLDAVFANELDNILMSEMKSLVANGISSHLTLNNIASSHNAQLTHKIKGDSQYFQNSLLHFAGMSNNATAIFTQQLFPSIYPYGNNQYLSTIVYNVMLTARDREITRVIDLMVNQHLQKNNSIQLITVHAFAKRFIYETGVANMVNAWYKKNFPTATGHSSNNWISAALSSVSKPLSNIISIVNDVSGNRLGSGTSFLSLFYSDMTSFNKSSSTVASTVAALRSSRVDNNTPLTPITDQSRASHAFLSHSANVTANRIVSALSVIDPANFDKMSSHQVMKDIAYMFHWYAVAQNEISRSLSAANFEVVDRETLLGSE